MDEEEHQSEHAQISIKWRVFGSCDIDKIDDEHLREKKLLESTQHLSECVTKKSSIIIAIRKLVRWDKTEESF